MRPSDAPDTRAVVAVGSNLGDAVTLASRGLHRLRHLASAGFAASSLWRSSPVDCPAGSADFVNAVCLFAPRPGETPESLLSALQAIEREFGRRAKTVPNEPRPLDLDLIAFGAETRSTPALTLPHPRAHERRFVLEPLAEIAPDLHPPGWAASAAQLLARLRTGEVVIRLGNAAGAGSGKSR